MSLETRAFDRYTQTLVDLKEEISPEVAQVFKKKLKELEESGSSEIILDCLKLADTASTMMDILVIAYMINGEVLIRYTPPSLGEGGVVHVPSEVGAESGLLSPEPILDLGDFESMLHELEVKD